MARIRAGVRLPITGCILFKGTEQRLQGKRDGRESKINLHTGIVDVASKNLQVRSLLPDNIPEALVASPREVACCKTAAAETAKKSEVQRRYRVLDRTER